ncbi:MAG: carboxypeptidase-like regulatory domain-containing protein [Gemmatimonadota bacterium]|nr:carboxypeptidase-like regulatory domain-containing protein [Gemmatimonadota bacterium]
MLSACTSPNDVLCTEIAIPGINVLVRDSVSGAFGSNGATATAVDGAYSDTNGFPATHTQPENPIALAYEREGTYAVTVTKTGYKAWTASGVRVTRDRCHVRTVTLNARLQH